MKRSKNFEKRKKFIMELLGDPLYKPMRLREIASLLQLDKSEKKELFDVLDELCAQGKAEVDNKGRYSKVSGKRRDRRKKKDALKAEKQERGRKGRERKEHENGTSFFREGRNYHGRNVHRPLQGFWIRGSGRPGTGYFYSGK